jgi:hypothetical protein
VIHEKDITVKDEKVEGYIHDKVKAPVIHEHLLKPIIASSEVNEPIIAN